MGWYYNNNYSWGFAPAGEPINRVSCDYDDGSQTFSDRRMCWHTNSGNINVGYRCGESYSVGGDYERLVFQAP